MVQILHGSARTTEAVRRAIQHSQESLRALAKRYGVNQKTIAKWRKRSSVCDQRTGPKEPRSSVLSVEEEAIIVAFRRHTLCRSMTALCLAGDHSASDAFIATSLSSAPRHFAIAEGRATKSPQSVNSKPIRSATSTSTSPRCAHPKASSTCSWRSTERQSSPSSNCMREPRPESPPTFWPR